MALLAAALRKVGLVGEAITADRDAIDGSFATPDLKETKALPEELTTS
jgi:hypothetical protein